MPIEFTAPGCYIAWMNQNLGFNPRSQKASDYLSSCVLDDLRRLSPVLDQRLSAESLKWEVDRAVGTRAYSRDIDLVVFDPLAPGPLDQAELTVENKSIMTAHSKARFNRQGDLIAYFNHVHNHSRRAVVGAVMVLNISSEYANPDRIPTKTPRRHLSAEYVLETMRLYQFLLRENPEEPNDQPEGMAIVLVDYDGVHEARLVTEPPALPHDSPYSYDNFCGRMARVYEARFSP